MGLSTRMEFIAQIKGGMALTQQLLIFQGGMEVRLGDVEVRLREEVDATSSQETIGSLRREKKRKELKVSLHKHT